MHERVRNFTANLAPSTWALMDRASDEIVTALNGTLGEKKRPWRFDHIPEMIPVLRGQFVPNTTPVMTWRDTLKMFAFSRALVTRDDLEMPDQE